VSNVRKAKAVGLGAAVVLALAPGCGHPREQALVDQFFSASRLRDKTAAQTVSTVFFDPKDQGLVRDFTIDSVGAEEQDESGGVTTKSVRLSASVESPEGLTSKKTIFVTMQRRPGAAWMITGVMVAVPAPPPSRDPSAPPR
jgi:hypothetical protein